MTRTSRNFLIWFCFMVVVILYAAFGCDYCNPYRMEDPKQDTVQGVIRPYVDSLQPDTIKWIVEPEMINP